MYNFNKKLPLKLDVPFMTANGWSHCSIYNENTSDYVRINLNQKLNKVVGRDRG